MNQPSNVPMEANGDTRQRPSARHAQSDGAHPSTIPENPSSAPPASPKSKDKAEENGESSSVVSTSRTNTAGRPESIVPLQPLDRRTTTQMERGGEPDEKKTGAHRSLSSQLRATLFSNWVNVLLVFAPVGIALHFGNVNVNASVIFVMNFIAIMPLAAMLCYGTEQVALYCGEVLGGLLNASFGNAVELIVAIIALVQGEVQIVQTSLVGSVLSNLLLVLGMSFIAGGIWRHEQYFNTTVAQASTSLLALAVACLIVPTAFHGISSTDNDAHIAQLSRGVAIIMLLIYGSYIFFQLKSHAHLYNAPSQKVPDRRESSPINNPFQTLVRQVAPGTVHALGQENVDEVKREADVAKKQQEADEPDEPEIPDLSVPAALITLIAPTVLVGLCAEGMVSSIDALVAEGPLNRAFVGLILLPIVGNAAEHVTAVTVAYKDKMDLSIGVAVGSSLQISLLVLPVMVVLGWIIGQGAMTLYLDQFQVIMMFITVILVNYIIADGKSNYLEGNLLVATYLIIALAAWFYPQTGPLAQAGS